MSDWTDIGATTAMTPNRGVAALIDGRQVAIFLVHPGGEILAIDNIDPFSGAAVMSRGIVGSVGDVLTVASPVYKQRFNLRTGACVDDPSVSIATYPARAREGRIEVCVEVPVH